MWWTLKAFLLKPAAIILALVVAVAAGGGGLKIGGWSKERIKDDLAATLAELAALQDEFDQAMVQRKRVLDILEEREELLRGELMAERADRKTAQRLAARHQRISIEIEERKNEILAKLEEVNAKDNAWASTLVPDAYRKLRKPEARGGKPYFPE